MARLSRCWVPLVLAGLFPFLSSPAIVAAKVQEVKLVLKEIPGSPNPEAYFEPTGLFIQPGDTVRFIASTPHHTVTAYHRQHAKPQRVPEGVEPFSSPVLPVGSTWEYTFRVRGVYDLWCAPHEMFGMVMRLVVGGISGPAAEPSTDFGPLGTFGAAGTVLSDAALDPQNILSKGAVSWDAISTEAKKPPMGPPPGH